jgi:hypothetical protein
MRSFCDFGRQWNNSKIKCFHESSVDAITGAAHPRNSGSEFYASYDAAAGVEGSNTDSTATARLDRRDAVYNIICEECACCRQESY